MRLGGNANFEASLEIEVYWPVFNRQEQGVLLQQNPVMAVGLLIFLFFNDRDSMWNHASGI